MGGDERQWGEGCGRITVQGEFVGRIDSGKKTVLGSDGEGAVGKSVAHWYERQT